MAERTCGAASRAWVLAAVALLGALGAAWAGDAPRDVRRPKKLIATGWDLDFDTAWLREHAPQMQQRPFDGLVIKVVGRSDDGKPVPVRETFSRTPWKAEWFDGAVEDLKACGFRRFTDNFVQIGANPGDVDWFDDAGWRAIVDHCRIAARVARRSGARGILFDPEPYTAPHAQFSWAAQPGHGRHTFDEYAAKARERGRACLQAMAEEHPDLVLFCYFMNSVVASAAGRADPRPVLAGQGYGLLPAFIDGWLDAAPPAVTFVDGCEHAYRFNSRLDFLEAANRIRGACQELVSPDNRAKYRAQVQVSFGIYLDAHVNPPTSPWYIDGRGGPRVDRLRANVCDALGVADEYVWIYGEKYRWWPTPNKGVGAESWNDVLPGAEDALRWARDPDAYGRFKIEAAAKAGTLANAARNGDFASDKAATETGAEVAWRKDGPPAGWSAWQDEKSKGTLVWDREAGAAGKGAARAAGVSNGCFLQKVAAKPGQRWAVRALRQVRGAGRASVLVRWQDADQRWTAEDRDRPFFCEGPAGEWGEIFGVVEVPEGAGFLVLLLAVHDQASADDLAWFDDVAAYALD
jgi:hypothetical protein